MQVRNLFSGLVLGLLSINATSQEIGDAIPDYQEFYKNAIELIAENEPAQALEKLNEIHEGDTMYLDAIAQKAIANYRLGNVEETQRLLNQLEGRNHGCQLDVFEAKIGLKALNEDPKGVQSEMDFLVTEYGNISRAHIILGDALVKSGDPAEGLKSYEKAVELNPYDAEAHYRIADFAYFHEKYTLAVSASYMATCAKWSQSDFDQEDVDRFNSICDVSAEKNKRFDGTNSAVFAYAQNWSTSDVILKDGDSEGEAPKLSVRLDQPFVSPLAYVADVLADDKNDSKNAVMEMYKSLFSEIREKNQLNGMVVLPVFGMEGDEAEEKQRLFKSKITSFKAVLVPQIESFTKSIRVKMDGVWKKKNFNFVKGILSSVGDIEDDIPDGDFIFYHSNGQVLMTAVFKRGRKDEIIKIYDRYGNRVEEQEWDSGRLTGVLKRWDANDNLILEGDADSYGRIKNVTVYGWNGAKSMSYKMNSYGSIDFNYFNESGGKSVTTYKAAGSAEEIVKSRYHDNGVIAYSYQLGGKKATFFNENGNEMASGPMSKNLRHKEWTWVNDEGVVLENGKYSKGLKHGVWYTYYSDGSVQEFSKYSKGLIHGVEQSLDYNGKTVMYLKYKKGVPVMLQAYSPDSTIIYEATTSSGQMEYKRYNNLRNCSLEGTIVGKEKDGVWKEYFYNGTLSDEDEFEDGKRVGVSTNFHYNGAPSSKYYYKQDTLVGYFERYYKNGQVKETGYFQDGRQNGHFKAYDIFGNLAEEAFLIDGKTNGPKTFYYDNGKVRRVIYYKMDVIDRIVSFNTKGEMVDEYSSEKGQTDHRLLHPNGEVYLETKLKNSIMDGEATWYSPNKTILRKQTEVDGYTHGAYKTYFDNGQPRFEGEYEWGDRIGEWKKYSSDSTMTRIDVYEDGSLNGMQKHYTKTGELYCERNFVNGSLHGVATYYGSTGEIGAELVYVNSTLVEYRYLDASGNKKTVAFPKSETGEVVCYYQNGNESLRFNLKNGMRDGAWVLSYENGQEHFISNYSDGMSQGDSMEFGMDGTLWSSAKYELGSIDGKIVENYADGTPAAVIEATQGWYHGPATFYDKDGTVTLKGNYVYDSFYAE